MKKQFLSVLFATGSFFASAQVIGPIEVVGKYMGSTTTTNSDGTTTTRIECDSWYQDYICFRIGKKNSGNKNLTQDVDIYDDNVKISTKAKVIEIFKEENIYDVYVIKTKH
ncbi:MAG: hypothetical protein SFU27_10145 [Thermonemataceae bacterium]|nr:hypothetical protein [Thermonemataceae bacterium]